nr:hypothetical protein [Tanacetum cinerariifolium]
MALTFAETHNMIAYLIKLDASEGFEQILDFLNASMIQVGKGFSRVDTPLFEGMVVPHGVNDDIDVADDVDADVADDNVADAAEPTPPPLQQELIPSTS